jgi:hypothetical protein
MGASFWDPRQSPNQSPGSHDSGLRTRHQLFENPMRKKTGSLPPFTWEGRAGGSIDEKSPEPRGPSARRNAGIDDTVEGVLLNARFQQRAEGFGVARICSCCSRDRSCLKNRLLQDDTTNTRHAVPQLLCFQDFARNSLSPIDHFAIFP